MVRHLTTKQGLISIRFRQALTLLRGKISCDRQILVATICLSNYFDGKRKSLQLLHKFHAWKIFYFLRFWSSSSIFYGLMMRFHLIYFEDRRAFCSNWKVIKKPLHFGSWWRKLEICQFFLAQLRIIDSVNQVLFCIFWCYIILEDWFAQYEVLSIFPCNAPAIVGTNS